jgi:DNA repair photolyase
MTVKEIEAKSILRRQKRVDSWFLSRYGMNLYRGCAHDCAYCDGRAEGYYVEGEFGRDVAVKVNAAEVLHRELDPARRRVPLRRAYVMLGGGVGDCYQPAEERYGLARKALEVIEEHGFPVHVLTKSSLVERDLDLLQRINQRSRAIVSVSLSSAGDEVSRVFEPGGSPPSRRLATLARAKRHGLATGVFLLPVIPHVTDSPEMIDEALARAREAGVDFVVFGGMTLKQGRQRQHFLEVLERFRPGLAPRYATLYGADRWGNARGDYYGALEQTFGQLARAHGVARRAPTRLFRDILDENDRVVVVLENIDYLLRLEGQSSPYRSAARSVAGLKQPLSEMRGQLRQLRGVGRATERIILEVLDTGMSAYHDSLL